MTQVPAVYAHESLIGTKYLRNKTYFMPFEGIKTTKLTILVFVSNQTTRFENLCNFWGLGF